MASKRKHTELSIEEKKLLCEFKKKSPRCNQEELAAWCQTKFEKTPGRSTIGGILRQSEKYLNNDNASNTAARERDPKCQKLEQALILWLNEICPTVSISTEMLRAKAKQLAENPALGVPQNFKFSNGCC